MNEQEILDNAPEGATHYLVNQYDFTEGYFKLTEDCDVLVDAGEEEGWRVVSIDVTLNGNYEVRSVVDVKTIVEQQKRIDDLHSELESKKQECYSRGERIVELEKALQSDADMRDKVRKQRDKMASRIAKAQEFLEINSDECKYEVDCALNGDYDND